LAAHQPAKSNQTKDFAAKYPPQKKYFDPQAATDSVNLQLYSPLLVHSPSLPGARDLHILCRRCCLKLFNWTVRNLIASLLSAALIVAAFAAQPAAAQKEFPPPQGKGRIVLVASGKSGPSHYEFVSKEIARLGYDVMLFDGNAMEGTNGEGLRTAIAQAKQAPHGLPGKMAIVGFSLGGGMALYYGVQQPDDVAGVVAWYPATNFIKNIPGWVAKVKVPVLMFAGEKDRFDNNCCVIEKAHILDDAAKAGGLDFKLVTYPRADHDFVKDGMHYNAEAYSDALQLTAAKLKEFLGDPGAPAGGQ